MTAGVGEKWLSFNSGYYNVVLAVKVYKFVEKNMTCMPMSCFLYLLIRLRD